MNEVIEYKEILEFKEQTIDYFLGKMKEIYNKTFNPEHEKRPLKVTGKDIGEGAWQIAMYADAFFLEITSFFDILARHFTENENRNKDIYFQNWIESQNSLYENDGLINYLNKQLNWYIKFKRVRNRLGHESHIWHEIDSIMTIDEEIKILTMQIGDKKTGYEKIKLVEYCEDIRMKLADMVNFIETKHYWNRHYAF